CADVDGRNPVSHAPPDDPDLRYPALRHLPGPGQRRRAGDRAHVLPQGRCFRPPEPHTVRMAERAATKQAGAALEEREVEIQVVDDQRMVESLRRAGFPQIQLGDLAESLDAGTG